MRAWLLTNTTYGTWLPGSKRGSVTAVRDRRAYDQAGEERVVHNLPGEEFEKPIPGLEMAAVEQLKGPPIHLDFEKAEVVLAQFQETAQFRGWILHAVAVMHNHWHLVVVAEDEQCAKKMLADFKSYASRTLNRKYGKPPSETWWTSKGSTRSLDDDVAFSGANHYVVFDQPRPLVVWSLEKGRIV